MSKKPKEITEPYGFVGGKMLKELLEKEPAALTKDEMDILRARRSYLNEEQLEKYEISDDAVKPEKDEEEEEEEKDEDEDEKEVDLSKFSVKELKELAEEEAIDIKGLKTKDELIDAISAADEDEEDEDEEEEEE